MLYLLVMILNICKEVKFNEKDWNERSAIRHPLPNFCSLHG